MKKPKTESSSESSGINHSVYHQNIVKNMVMVMALLALFCGTNTVSSLGQSKQ